MCERGILTHLVNQVVTPQREEDYTNTKGRNIGNGRSHHINKFQWRL